MALKENKNIWKGQSLVNLLIKKTASDIFKRIDKNLIPKTFIIGISLNNFKTSISLSEIFNKNNIELLSYVKSNAKKKFENNINILKRTNQNFEISAVDKRFELKRAMIINAIENLIEENTKLSDHIYFNSLPVIINDHLIFLIMKFQKKVINTYYFLKNNEIYDKFSIPTSFVKAVIYVFLEKCADVFQISNKREKENIFQNEYDEIFRNSGRILMYLPSIAARGVIEFRDIFNTINSISTLKYEGAECTGKIIISKKNHPDIEILILFIEPISMNSYQAVRKLIEISSSKMSLLSDSGYIYGFGYIKDSYDHKNEDIFIISFKRHNSWEFSHGNNIMMQVIKGVANLPKDKIEKKDFVESIKKIFKSISDDSINKIWEIILEVIKEKKGTMLVVSEGASKEATRLKNQSIIIEPLELNNNILKNITKIDGAVLMDTDSICYAIGVILDGLASSKGTS